MTFKTGALKPAAKKYVDFVTHEMKALKNAIVDEMADQIFPVTNEKIASTAAQLAASEAYSETLRRSLRSLVAAEKKRRRKFWHKVGKMAAGEAVVTGTKFQHKDLPQVLKKGAK